MSIVSCGPGTDADKPIVIDMGHSDDVATQPDLAVDIGGGDGPDQGHLEDLGCEPDCGIDEVAPGVWEVSTLEFDGAPPVLDLLPQVTGDAPIVSVGETIHFSDGYARARAVVIRSLIEDHGFRAVAFEGSWFDGLTVDAYVAQGQGTVDDALFSLTFGAWMNAPTRELLGWMRQWNTDHPEDPVRVFGIDVQDPIGSGVTLRGELVGNFSDEADALVSDIDVCLGAEHDSWQAASADAYFAGVFNRTETYAEADYLACTDAVAALRQWVEANRADLETALDPLAVTLVEVSLRTLDAWNGEIFFINDYRRSSESRDAGIADVFTPMWQQVGGGKKTVIFAHNAHNRRRAGELGGDAVFKSYGSFLHERYGLDYAPIGFFAEHVEWNWPNEIGAGSWTATDPNSVEFALSVFDKRTLLVDLEAATSAGGLFEPGASHPMGHASTVVGVPRDHYRAILYMHVSEPRP